MKSFYIIGLVVHVIGSPFLIYIMFTVLYFENIVKFSEHHDN